jgi:ComF family protein
MMGWRLAKQVTKHWAVRGWDDVSSFAFPASCAACGTAMVGAGPLCDVCDDRLNDLRRIPSCPRCAAPLPDANGPCGRCNGRGLTPLRSVVRFSTFESTTRDLVHAIKYGKRWPIVDVVAGWMKAQPRVAALLAEADVIVPVPLHWTRRFLRGFNQADLLARALADTNQLTIVHALKRVRATKSQTAFHSRAARRRNMAGAFELVHASQVEARRVVLVDDVMTSGATLQMAARQLRQARPAWISAIVIGTANPLKTDLAV